MNDKPETKEEKPEPVVVVPDVPDTEYKTDLSCPPGFPPEKWKRKGDGYKRNYYNVVESNKKAGGKK